MTYQGDSSEDQQAAAEPIRFPGVDAAEAPGPIGLSDPRFALTCLPQTAEQIYRAIDSMSRRIDHLARELECLGYFDEPDDDGPRAA